MEVKRLQACFTLLLNLALIAGLASTLVVPNGTGIWPVVFSMVGLVLLFGRLNVAQSTVPPVVSKVASWLALTAILATVVPLSIDLLHNNPISLDPYITFLLLPSIAVVIYRYRIKPDTFFIGVLLGAISACLLAYYEHFIEGIGRAKGYMNPIPFGDICVLMALTLAIRAASCWTQNRKFALLLLFGAICGAYASLLSGSKGGWLALILGLTLMIWRTLISAGLRRRTSTSIIALTAILVYLAVPDMAKSRIQSGFEGGIEWVKTGQITEGSVSARLELWTWGLLGFKQSPIIGQSQEALRELRIDAAADGRLDPKINRFPDTVDNEFLIQLANRGILGFITTIVTFAVPFFAFRCFRKHPNHLIRDLSFLGQLMPLIFVEFGLSVSIWGTSTFRLVYVSWIILLISLIAVQYHRSATDPKEV